MSTGATILSRLREKMQAKAINALIIPSSDAHNSEYVAAHLQKRAFVSNFYGSAGTVLVTMDKALLWTDGRYWLAAEESMYPEFSLMKQGKLDVPNIDEWIEKHLSAEARVGLDPYVCTIAEWERMSQKIKLTPVDNLVGPMMPAGGEESEIHHIFCRPAKFCGRTCREKRQDIVKEMEKEKCEVMVLSALDEVAWLTNLRGADVPYNPVFISYAIVDASHKKIRLYLNLQKVTEEVRKECEHDIEFYHYSQFEKDLTQIAAKRNVLVDVRQTSEALQRLLRSPECEATLKKINCGPAQKLKAIKNDVELQGFRDCHVRDGAALTRYLAWLYDQIANKNVTTLNEYDAAAYLEKLRSQNEHFVQLSFASISSTGKHIAIIHYTPPASGSANITKDELYLIDSGAQYYDGTTDVTRTVCFVPPKDFEKEAYTRVLKGHIAMNRIVFPKGAAGHRLDSFARQALWQVGLDYNHGTGHGVGSFLNVHEGPHSIGFRVNPTEANVELHCIVSNEPGYYKDGAFGARIENLEEVVSVKTKYSEEGFYGMKYLTYVPLCRELIDADLLTSEEVAWVNNYHKEVLHKLMPLLEASKDTMAVEYLKHHTDPIETKVLRERQ